MARLVFMGTPDFAVAPLEALVKAGHDIPAVFSQPPRPSGRGLKTKPSPVHLCAQNHELTVHTPTSLKDSDWARYIRSLECDLAIVVAYGMLLPQDILDAFDLGCFNIHASLLPRWRGAAPIQRAIMAGDDETGICFMRMTKGLDEGPVLARSLCAIKPGDTSGLVHDYLRDSAAQSIDVWVRALMAGRLEEKPQENNGVTYASKIQKSETRISFDGMRDQVVSFINGLSPFPGAWCELDGARVKFLRAVPGELHGPTQVVPGSVVGVDEQSFCVSCLDGNMHITHLQRQGKSAQTALTFMRGTHIEIGMRFS